MNNFVINYIYFFLKLENLSIFFNNNINRVLITLLNINRVNITKLFFFF